MHQSFAAREVKAMAVRYLSVVMLALLARVFSIDVDCPPWFILDITNDPAFPQCVCSDVMKGIITCNQRERISSVKIGHCAYQDLHTNSTVVAYCPYVFPVHLINNGLIRLPHNITQLNAFTCSSLQREAEALFCGRCINGTGPSVYSFGSQCAECSTVNIFFYLLLQYVPITTIFVVILLLRYSIVSPPMSHFIIYCNIVRHGLKTSVGQFAIFAYANIYVRNAFRLVLTLISLWTLDPLYFISPPLCISENIHELYIPMLDSAAALYPFILLSLTYVLIEMHAKDCKPIVFMWKLCKCGNIFSFRNTGKSLIEVFATLYFLSLMKFIGIVCDLTVATTVINMNNSVLLTVSYIDPTITLFSYQYLPNGVLAIAILILFLAPPILLLVFYPTPCFKKVSSCFSPRWLLSIKIFTDTFYGSYKDGTNGTRDYRPVAGLIFVFWVMFPILDGIITLFLTFTFPWFLTFIPVLIALAISCVVLEPYKHKAANTFGTVLLLILTVASGIAGTLDGYNFSSSLALMGITALVLPHFVVYGYAILWLVRRVTQCNQNEESRQLLHP